MTREASPLTCDYCGYTGKPGTFEVESRRKRDPENPGAYKGTVLACFRRRDCNERAPDGGARRDRELDP